MHHKSFRSTVILHKGLYPEIWCFTKCQMWYNPFLTPSYPFSFTFSYIQYIYIHTVYISLLHPSFSPPHPLFPSRTMKTGVGLYTALVLCLLMGTVFLQRPRPKKPPKPPKPTKRPSFKPAPPPKEPEPQEPTDFPPPILGPPSMFNDCPRECFCPPSFPNALYCENRNLRTVPVIPSRVHYLYLQNNYISEVTAEPFNNATELRWVNMANNRIKKVDKQVRALFDLFLKYLIYLVMYSVIFIHVFFSLYVCLSVSLRCLRRYLVCCFSTWRGTS